MKAKILHLLEDFKRTDTPLEDRIYMHLYEIGGRPLWSGWIITLGRTNEQDPDGFDFDHKEELLHAYSRTDAIKKAYARLDEEVKTVQQSYLEEE